MPRCRISNAGRGHEKVCPKEEEEERKQEKKREGAAGVESQQIL